jgi:four helix bundle protein
MKYRASKAWHFSHELALEVHELVREVVETDRVAAELAVKMRKSSARAPLALKASARKELMHEKLQCYQMSRKALEELHSHLLQARELQYVEKKLFKKMERLAIKAHHELTGLIENTEQSIVNLQAQ